MITVEQALDHLFALVKPLGAETVPLARANGRVLAQAAVAGRDQPPFDASAMDGYALRNTEARAGARFKVVGESAAGKAFSGIPAPGETVRIFTGAPVPAPCDRVVIQENVHREGNHITLTEAPDKNVNIRPLGADFHIGSRLEAPRRLSPADVALLAAMNIPEVTVARRPRVALISTGNELVMPGDTPGPDQIIASNSFALKAMLQDLGADASLLPIARDTVDSLETVFGLAEGADLIVTIGGASVGDHDLVGKVAADLGMQQSFYKVAVRPGKPLMAGRIGTVPMLGLPGNPVSSIVCGQIFLAPMIRVMQGLPARATKRHTARLASDLPENGPREHYMRAEWNDGLITPEPSQDSALLSVLAHANALLIRPVNDPPRKAGEQIEYIPL